MVFSRFEIELKLGSEPQSLGSKGERDL